ncbi:MAG: hypothetical protein ABIR81_01660 [Ginsengibacter sp.]
MVLLHAFGNRGKVKTLAQITAKPLKDNVLEETIQTQVNNVAWKGWIKKSAGRYF